MSYCLAKTWHVTDEISLSVEHCWKRRLLSRLQSTNPWKSDKNGEASHSGRLFTKDDRQSETWKVNGCFTLLKRITKLKCVNSDIGSLHHILLRKAFPEGFMPPWRIQHESHTCSEQSLRILMWNASYVQKHSINLTGKVWRQDQRRISKFVFPRPC